MSWTAYTLISLATVSQAEAPAAGISGWTITLIAVIVAAAMQGLNIAKCRSVHAATGGAIKGRQDLLLVKEAINLSMRLAIVYIAMYLLLILALVFLVYTRALPFFGAVGSFFWFGVLTLPLGLIGKGFEKKIQTINLDAADEQSRATYQRWLIQWREPRIQLPE